jgi:hypothetical protein
MINIKPSQIIECIAYNMRQEKEVFKVKILENDFNSLMVKKGHSKLTLDKRTNTMKNSITGLKCYTKVRFFLRK